MRNLENLKMGKFGKWKSSKIGNLEISKFGKFGNRKFQKMRDAETLKIERGEILKSGKSGK